MDQVPQYSIANFDMTVQNEDGTAQTVTSGNLVYEKPDGTLLTKTASVPSASVLRYTSTVNDLTMPGVWAWQGFPVIGGSIRPTSVHQFEVTRSLTTP